MKLYSGITSFVEEVYAIFDTLFKVSSSSYIDLETADPEGHYFVRPDGTLMSLIQVHGTQNYVGVHEFDHFIDRITDVLSTLLSRPGHSIHIVYERDSALVDRDIERMLAPSRQTAERTQLNAGWILDAKKVALSRFCSGEACYIAISTNFGIFSASEVSRAANEYAQSWKDKPRGKHSQILSTPPFGLLTAHNTSVERLINSFNDQGLICHTVQSHDAIRVMRMAFDPQATSDQWKPLLPGDKFPVRAAHLPRRKDPSNILHPKLSEQITPRGAGEIIAYKRLQIGSRIHAPVVMNLPPQQVEPFNGLMSHLLATEVPFRVAFHITPNALRSFGLKMALASVLKIQPKNRLFDEAYQQLRELELADETVAGFRFCADTWADDDKTASQRGEALMQAVQAWGQAEAVDVSGDPLMGVTATVPGATLVSPAPMAAAPLRDVSVMLPLTRPASPWNSGAMLFRTPDGKLMPYQPGSRLQTAWVTLGFAAMGKGKSVLLNAYNMALCLLPGLERLPYISILDIGPSSSGLISALKHSLPKHLQHQVAYHRLQMSADYAINLFDTPLGMRKPLPSHKAALVDFITLLCTPEGEKKAQDGVSGIAGVIIDLMYDELKDDRNPKRFDPSIDRELTRFIEERDYRLDQHSSWWEIVDMLFEDHQYDWATRAQRYAVPTLADCAQYVRDPAVTAVYKGSTDTQETIIDYVWRCITESIGKYPILSTSTRFDLGTARVISMDLMDVAPKGGASADKQTAIMYLVARYVLSQRYYMDSDALDFMPVKYRDHWKERIKEIKDDVKAICMDEFHRTQGVEAVRSQIVRDIREGRKFKVQVVLFSQSLDDFDKIVVSLSSTRFVLGAETPEDAREIVERFGLTESAKDIIANKITKPGPKGAGLYMSVRTEKGSGEMFVYNTLGPVELWAYDSTAENRLLREAMYEQMGVKDALSALAWRYPSGSAVEDVDRRRAQMTSEANQGQLIERMANELIDAWHEKLRLEEHEMRSPRS